MRVTKLGTSTLPRRVLLWKLARSSSVSRRHRSENMLSTGSESLPARSATFVADAMPKKGAGSASAAKALPLVVGYLTAVGSGKGDSRIKRALADLCLEWSQTESTAHFTSLRTAISQRVFARADLQPLSDAVQELKVKKAEDVQWLVLLFEHALPTMLGKEPVTDARDWEAALKLFTMDGLSENAKFWRTVLEQVVKPARSLFVSPHDPLGGARADAQPRPRCPRQRQRAAY